MAIRIWQACDLILSNTTQLRLAGPYDCSVNTKPEAVTLTLDAAVLAGDTSITITTAAGFIIPKNVEISFGGKLVITDAETGASGTTISILPAAEGIADAATASISPLFEVYSANEASHTINENEVTDRVFGAGVWTTSKITNRSAEISVNGVRVKNDPGLNVARETSKTIKRVYFELVDPDGTLYEGWGNIKGLNIQRQVDNNEQVSFSIGVDGEFIETLP